MVLVAGGSGVGKSRLVAEIGERARSAGARVLIGDCVEVGEGELPYVPLVSALRSRDEQELVELAGPGRADLALLLSQPDHGGTIAEDGQFSQLRMFERAHVLRSEVEALGRRTQIKAGRGPSCSDPRTSAVWPDRPRARGASACGGRGEQPRNRRGAVHQPKTASAHVSHILAKLEVRSRGEAAALAHRLGLLGELSARELGLAHPRPRPPGRVVAGRPARRQAQEPPRPTPKTSIFAPALAGEPW